MATTIQTKFKCLRLTHDCRYVEVDFGKMENCLLPFTHSTQMKWFFKPSQLYLYTTVFSGALIKRFFLNYFSPPNSLQFSTWNMFYIPLPPFPSNYLTILPSGTNNDHQWVFTFCLNRWIEIGCAYFASLFYFFKCASLFSGLSLNRRFFLLYSLTVYF